RGNYQGLVLAPNHSRGILTPLRRALAARLPVVIVSAPLDFPTSDKLGYIVNDDEKLGEIAAAEIASLINAKGAIALVGLTPYATGARRRALTGQPVPGNPRCEPWGRGLQRRARGRAYQWHSGFAS